MDSRSGPRSSSSLARSPSTASATSARLRGASGQRRYISFSTAPQIRSQQPCPSSPGQPERRSASSPRTRRRAGSAGAPAPWRRPAPTSTRSGVSGSSIAPATANATVSGPGRPSGPTSVLSVPLHWACSSAYGLGPRMVGVVVLHAGSDVPRLDDHHADPEVTELEVHRLGHRLERMLRRRIGPFQRRADLALDRADVHQHAAAPLAPPRDHRLGHPERADGVDVEHLSEALQADRSRAVRYRSTPRCSRPRRARRLRPPPRAPSRRRARRAAGPARPATPPAGATSRAVATTSCPRSASTSTVARPMARAAPVTSTRTAQIPCAGAPKPTSSSLTCHRRCAASASCAQRRGFAGLHLTKYWPRDPLDLGGRRQVDRRARALGR